MQRVPSELWPKRMHRTWLETRGQELNNCGPYACQRARGSQLLAGKVLSFPNPTPQGNLHLTIQTPKKMGANYVCEQTSHTKASPRQKNPLPH